MTEGNYGGWRVRGDTIPTFSYVKKKCFFLLFFFSLLLHLNSIFEKKNGVLKIIVPSADVAIMVDNVQLALHRVSF